MDRNFSRRHIKDMGKLGMLSPRHPAFAGREKKRCGLLIYDDQLQAIDRILDRLDQQGIPYSRAALVRRAIDEFLNSPATPPPRTGRRASVTTGIDLFVDQIDRLDRHITNDENSTGRSSRTAVIRHALDLFVNRDQEIPFDPARPAR